MPRITVYDGYIFDPPGNSGLEALLPRLGAFVAEAKNACHDAVARQLARRTAEMIDNATLGLKPGTTPEAARPGRSALGIAWQEAEDDRRRLQRGERSVYHDWECLVLVYAAADQPILLRMVAEQREVYQPLFESLPGVRPFQFDSIPPEGMRERFTPLEWAWRERLWNAAIDSKTLLTGAPLTLTAVEERGVRPDVSAVLAAQPTLADRAWERAEKALRDEAFRRWLDKDGMPPNPDEYMYRVSEAMYAWKEHSLTETGRAEIAARANAYATRLVPRFEERNFRSALPVDAVAEPASPDPDEVSPRL